MAIEQAIYTSSRTGRYEGYQLVSRSAGLEECDARELAAWGPSHDSLLEGDASGRSANFFPLPSGAYCISKTAAAGHEYSGRGGLRVYTHCLIAPPEDLERFGNNPFALLRAAEAHGRLEVLDDPPPELASFNLAGRAAMVDRSLLARLSIDLGAQWLATLVQAVLTQPLVGLILQPEQRRACFEGVINCMPPAMRPQLSFTTGLKFSPRRACRLMCLPPDPLLRQRLERDYNLCSLEIGGEPPRRYEPVHAWARLVRRALRPDHLSIFAALVEHETAATSQELEAAAAKLLPQLEQRSAGAMCGSRQSAELPSDDMALLEALSLELHRDPHSEEAWRHWEALHERSLKRGNAKLAAELVRRACQIFGPPQQHSERIGRLVQLLRRQCQSHPEVLRHSVERLGELPLFDGREQWLRVAEHELAEQWSGSEEPAGAAEDPPRDEPPRHGKEPPLSAPSLSVAVKYPELKPQLERLDQTVAHALAGREEAARELGQLWPAVQSRLPAEAAEQARRQYLQYAVQSWDDPPADCPPRDPQRAIHTLELISVLLTR